MKPNEGRIRQRNPAAGGGGPTTKSDNEAVADHVNQARDFLAKSREYLTQSDLHQASERGWGAAAHMVKAVAIAQGWEYERHRDFRQVLNDEKAIQTQLDAMQPHVEENGLEVVREFQECRAKLEENGVTLTSIT